MNLNNKSFRRAYFNDTTVNKMVKAGCSLEDIIGRLAVEKEQYLKHIVELDLIAFREKLKQVNHE